MEQHFRFEESTYIFKAIYKSFLPKNLFIHNLAHFRHLIHSRHHVPDTV